MRRSRAGGSRVIPPSMGSRIRSARHSGLSSARPPRCRTRTPSAVDSLGALCASPWAESERPQAPCGGSGEWRSSQGQSARIGGAPRMPPGSPGQDGRHAKKPETERITRDRVLGRGLNSSRLKRCVRLCNRAGRLLAVVAQHLVHSDQTTSPSRRWMVQRLVRDAWIETVGPATRLTSRRAAAIMHAVTVRQLERVDERVYCHPDE